MSREPGLKGVVPETKTRLPTVTACESGARGLVKRWELRTFRVLTDGSPRASIDLDSGFLHDLRVFGDLAADELAEALGRRRNRVEPAFHDGVAHFGKR